MTRSIVQTVFGAVLGVLFGTACGPSVVVAAAPQRDLLVSEQPAPVLVPLAAAPAPTEVSGESYPKTGYHEVTPNAPPIDETPTDEISTEPDAAASEEVEDADPVALRRFRSDLDPYGQWIEDARYGTIWVPYSNVVGVSFKPYATAGYWTTTVHDEWLWVSDYPFGSVVFHYGRWVWVPGQGWAWVAGNRYAPSWVQFWVADGGYLGWAPLAPRHVWRSGTVVWIASPAPRPIVFVPRRHVYSRKVSEHFVGNTRHVQQLQRTARVTETRTPSYEKTVPPAHAAVPKSPGAASSNAVSANTVRPVPNAAAHPNVRDLSTLRLRPLPQQPYAKHRPGTKPAKIYSSTPKRSNDARVRQTWAGAKPRDKVADERRRNEIAAKRSRVGDRPAAARTKNAKPSAAQVTKARRADAKRRAAPVVIHPVVAPRAAAKPKPSHAKPRPPVYEPSVDKKARPPAARVRKIPQQFKLPPRRITPPSAKHAPTGRRKH